MTRIPSVRFADALPAGLEAAPVGVRARPAQSNGGGDRLHRSRRSVLRRSGSALLLLLLGALLQPIARSADADLPWPERDPERLRLASVQAAVAPLDGADGEYLFTREADRTVPIASVTKLMTALVVRESGAELEEWLEIVPRDFEIDKNTFTHLRVGSELRRRDLMRIMLQASENMAAHVLASHHPGGRAGFIEAMNATAARLGMTGTSFAGPSGLQPKNVSTAADLVKLARAAWADPVIREFSTGGYFGARFRNPGYTLNYGNTNPLIHSSSWDVQLSKTGYLNESGRCLVMVAELDGEPLIFVLLDSFGRRSPLGDAGRVRRWLQTGDSGGVAAAAADHVRRREAEYAARERAGSAGR